MRLPRAFRLPGFVLTLLAGTAAAQQPAEPSAPADIDRPAKVLHAYVNLVQIPVLVLDRDGQLYRSLDTSRFRMRIENGPVFAPRHVRLEGDDPLRITVLVDEHGSTARAAEEIDEALPRLMPGLIQRQDTVAVAVLRGCVAQGTPAFPADPVRIASAVKALNSPGGSGTDCRSGTRLWDSVGALINRMEPEHGRRVLLLLSDGSDSGSRVHMENLVSLAVDHAVTVFGIRLQTHNGDTSTSRRGGSATDRLNTSREPEGLEFLSASTGGMVLSSPNHTAQQELERAMLLVRARYIIDFARPEASRGHYRLSVSIGDDSAIIRPAGIGLPLATPEIDSPDRVPNDPALQTPVGRSR